MGALANSEDPDEMQHKLHFIGVNTVCISKEIFRQKNTIHFENVILTHLDM